MTADRTTPSAEFPDVSDTHGSQKLGRNSPSAEDLITLAKMIARAYADWHSGPDSTVSQTDADLGSHVAIRLPSWLAVHDRATNAKGFRAGYEAARGDLISGAFVGGPTYEALKASYSGRQIAAEALREAADEIEWKRPGVSPCTPNFEHCCGSEASCGAMQSSFKVVGAQWLRDRADRIEGGR